MTLEREECEAWKVAEKFLRDRNEGYGMCNAVKMSCFPDKIEERMMRRIAGEGRRLFPKCVEQKLFWGFWPFTPYGKRKRLMTVNRFIKELS